MWLPESAERSRAGGGYAISLVVLAATHPTVLVFASEPSAEYDAEWLPAGWRLDSSVVFDVLPELRAFLKPLQVA